MAASRRSGGRGRGSGHSRNGFLNSAKAGGWLWVGADIELVMADLGTRGANDGALEPIAIVYDVQHKLLALTRTREALARHNDNHSTRRTLKLVAATAIGDWLVIDRPPATVLHAAGPWRIHLQPAIIDGGGVSGRGVAWVTTRPSSAVDRRLIMERTEVSENDVTANARGDVTGKVWTTIEVQKIFIQW